MSDKYITADELKAIRKITRTLTEMFPYGEGGHVVSIGDVKVFDANGEVLGVISISPSGEFALYGEDYSSDNV